MDTQHSQPSQHPWHSPHPQHSQRSPRRASAYTLIELLVVIGIILVLMGLGLPAVIRAWSAGSHIQCQNNLRGLGVGLIDYQGSNDGFPPAVRINGPGNTCSWVPYLFPYLHREELVGLYDRNKDWADPANLAVAQYTIKALTCPAAPPDRTTAKGLGISDYSPTVDVLRPNPYAGNLPPPDPTGVGVLAYGGQRKIGDINDGTSCTLMLVECAGRDISLTQGNQPGSLATYGGWSDPRGYLVVAGYDPITQTIPGPVAINGCNAQQPYSYHQGQSGAVLADGSVRFIRDSCSLDVLIALTTRKGNEPVADTSW